MLSRKDVSCRNTFPSKISQFGRPPKNDGWKYHVVELHPFRRMVVRRFKLLTVKMTVLEGRYC